VWCPRFTLRVASVAATAAALSFAVGCGSEPPAQLQADSAQQGQEYWGADPLAAAVHLAEGQYTETLDAWQFRLSDDPGALPEYKWSVRKVNDAKWILTGKITGDDGTRIRGRWKVSVPLDHNPTDEQLARIDDGKALMPLDGGAIELSGCPPKGCEAAVGQ
jgi:hypothetical protein